MRRPGLTIITVTYNAGAFLERTLESVAKGVAEIGGSGRIEYLLIDGVSTDHTLEIAARYKDVLDIKIHSGPDRGLYDAMNKGLQLATGEYVWFLNAGDEVYDRTTAGSLLAALHSGADIYYSDALFVSPEGTPLGLRSEVTPHSLPEAISWKDMALGMKICHQAFIVKRELAPVYDIDNLSADLDWEIAAMKKAARIKCLDFILCRYLLGGLSAQRRRKSLADRWRVLKRHFGWGAAVLNHVRIAARGLVFYLKKGKYW
ncbi:MAG: glycosyl transferase [Cytophagaceae bacterium SCN 52-12]|nr:MAG: glycosyl transferase [Cytophagaceae bacterium SCN 52-12]